MFVSIFRQCRVMQLFAASFLVFVVSTSSVVAAQDSETSVDDQSIEDALNAIRDGDHQTGRAMLRTMSEQGNPDAMYHLAEISRLGIGGDASMSIATMFYRLASRLGHEKASMKLANILYFEGTQSAAEMAEAFSIWQTYALSGNAEAAYLLGIIYWNGENGRTPDPVRGYGLVWKAAEAGYKDAVAAELEMRTLLPGDARQAAQTYGARLADFGFSDELLNMDLLVEDWEPDAEETVVEKPEDWTAVWHLEVGFALRQDDAENLLADILENHAKSVEGLFNEMVPSPNRVGRFKLVFGPLEGMHSAVNLCVDLKRAGYDCFAKPPSANDSSGQ